MKLKLLIPFLFFALGAISQIAPDKYYVQFTDKNNSPYSIDSPEEFLSERALERRTRYNISITENDIPVNPSYIQGVQDIGVQILNPSKWLNGVTIHTNDLDHIDQINQLPYVSGTLKMTGSESTIIDKFKDLLREETSST